MYTSLSSSSLPHMTKSARLPSVIDPTSLRQPSCLAGFHVAALMASASGTPNEIARRMHSYTFVAEPAIVPSASLATPPERNTCCPPRSYSPSGMPQQRSESEISTIRSAPNMRNARQTHAGCTCSPSLISSAETRASSAAATIGAGPAVMYGRHGVEKVGDMRCPCVDSRFCLRVVCVCVSNGYCAVSRGLFYKA